MHIYQTRATAQPQVPLFSFFFLQVDVYEEIV
jgi:hypothetical protein